MSGNRGSVPHNTAYIPLLRDDAALSTWDVLPYSWGNNAVFGLGDGYPTQQTAALDAMSAALNGRTGRKVLDIHLGTNDAVQFTQTAAATATALGQFLDKAHARDAAIEINLYTVPLHGGSQTSVQPYYDAYVGLYTGRSPWLKVYDGAAGIVTADLEPSDLIHFRDPAMTKMAALVKQVLLGTAVAIPVPSAAPATLSADYTTVKTAIEGTGLTLTTAQNTAGDRLVRDLHGETNAAYATVDVWAKVLGIWPMLGGTAAAHKFNWKNPADTDAAYRLTFPNGATHAATGVAWNGTSQYANTFLTGLVANNATLGYYARNRSTTANDVSIGTLSQEIYIQLKNSAGQQIFSSGGGGTTAGGTQAAGGWVLGTALGTSRATYNGAVGVSTTTNANAGTTTANIFLGTASNGANPSANYSNAECALALVGLGLTQAEAEAVGRYVVAYQTALGRNV